MEVQVVGRGKREMEVEAEKRSAEKKKREMGSQFELVIKLYGLGSIYNRGIKHILAPVFCHPRPNMKLLVTFLKY